MVLDDAVVNAQARAGYGLADAGTLRIMSGATVLASLRFGARAFSDPEAGRISALPLAPETAAPATGDADAYEVYAADGTTRLWRGSVGVTGSGSDLELNSVAIQQGSRVELTSGPTMTVPKE